MKRASLLLFILITIAGASLLSSCATTSGGNYPEQYKTEALSSIQNRLLEAASHYRGTQSGNLAAGGRTYKLDCSGALLAIYYRAGIDLEKCYTGYEGNGVKRLYSSLRDNMLIVNTKKPQVGDLIFWDNTWDRNGDRQYNDYFTHAGMVVAVDSDGTITYVHHNYRKGLVYEKMNLLKPNNTRLNSPMRMRGSPPAPNGQYLASHLVRVFGRAWKLPKSYRR